MVERMGLASSMVTILLVLLVVIDVASRYLFNHTRTWMLELEWHLFGLIFLLGAAQAYRQDKHIRVDVLYQNFSPKTKAIINLLGNVFLLIPWCIIATIHSFKYAYVSFSLLEGSPDPGGLAGRFIIKFSISLCFVLLIIESIQRIRNDLSFLKKQSRTTQ